MTMKLTVPVPRGMLFLYDQDGSGIEIPAYIEGETVASSKTAISIATISDIDGDATITLTETQDKTTKSSVEIFSGQLFLEHGILHVCIMGDESIAQLPLNEGFVSVTVYGDEAIFPKSISIVIKN